MAQLLVSDSVMNGCGSLGSPTAATSVGRLGRRYRRSFGNYAAVSDGVAYRGKSLMKQRRSPSRGIRRRNVRRKGIGVCTSVRDELFIKFAHNSMWCLLGEFNGLIGGRRIVIPTASNCARWSGVHLDAGMDGSRFVPNRCTLRCQSAFPIERQLSHVGSAVMMATGTCVVRARDARSRSDGEDVLVGPSPDPSRVKNKVTPTDMAITRSTATATSSHFKPLF